MATTIATAGPFVGVRTIDDAPFADASKYLYSAQNGYFRDVANGSSWESRPPFLLNNPNGIVAAGGAAAQGTVAHVDPTTGSIYRFIAAGGKLYRADSSLASFADVSPVGITIDAGTTTRVSFASVGASLVVTDGVNRPWVASNFGGTPITGTYIDIDGVGGAWSTWGKPAVYQDSVFFITATVPGGSAVQARVGIVWSEPNQPVVGYVQSAAGFADFWNLIETGSDPLYAILGTNSGLFLWRASAITVAAGTPSINFSSTATRDARGEGIGTVSPWAVAIFENNIFFIDALARPWMMSLSGEPQPIWMQMNALVTANIGAQAPALLSWMAVGAIAEEVNRYVVASSVQAGANPPVSISVFDGSSGAYDGEWVIGPAPYINVIDTQRDSNGLPMLCMCGGVQANTSGTGMWAMQTIAFANEINRWYDTNLFFAFLGNTPVVTTCLLGYSDDTLLIGDTADLLTRSSQTIASVAIAQSSGTTTLNSITPLAGAQSINQQYRSVIGLPGTGTRSLQMTITGPHNPTAQWGIQRIRVFGQTALAGPNDP